MYRYSIIYCKFYKHRHGRVAIKVHLFYKHQRRDHELEVQCECESETCSWKNFENSVVLLTVVIN